MPYPLPLTRTEAYLAYKAGVIQQSDLKPSLAVPRNGIDAWLAYWTGLAADYPKREDGTPHILQEEEAYIAYLSGVINEYPEKCLRRVGAYLRYLISARWGRPDHPLNREELYLSLIKTQFIPSGDPSTDIEIDGTAKAAFVDVKMYGDTFQQSYTGKNLLNINASIMEQDRNGIKITYEQETGIITINGTCSTDNTTFGFFASSDEPRQITVNGDVTVSCFYVSGSITNATADTKIQVQNNTYGNAIYVGLTNSDAHTTANKNDTYNRNNIRIDSGVVFDNYKIKVMVEQSATATAYEPYVGGQPSPNPDYPQSIQTVTGAQTVEVVGKNLFDKNHPNNSPCYVNNSGILTSGGGTNLSVYIPCEPSTTYTVSKSNKGTNNRFCVFDTETKPAVGVSVISTVGTRVGEDNSASYTFTTGANAHYLGVFYRAAATTPSESEIKDTIQIEKGSTATAYTQYSKHTYPINLGKNLLSAGLEVGGWLIGVGSTIEKTTNNNAYRCNAPIAVKPNTEYIFSINGAAFDQFRVVYANAAGTILSNEVFTGTIKTPDNCFQIVFYSSAMKSAYPNIEDIKAQLEVGGTVTPYAEYFTPIELCKLGAYQDYIWKDGEDWKVHKATANITLNNTADTSNWSKSNSTANNVYINQNIPNLVKDSPIVATNLTTYPTADIYSRDIVGICYNRTGAGLASIRIGVGLSGASTINLFKSWLESNPVTAHYALATATDNIITNQTLIDQLEALVKGGSEEGKTYIKLSTQEPNLPGLLYVEAAEYV